MSGDICLFPLYAMIAWTGTNLLLPLSVCVLNVYYKITSHLILT